MRARGGISRRGVLGLAAGLAALPMTRATASTNSATPEDVIGRWYKLVLQLVRHTATYSPPVASRAFAYLGIAAYEALAPSGGMLTLAGQVNGLTPVPAREAGKDYSDAVLLHAVMTTSTLDFFGNTGPSGQGAMAAMSKKLGAQAAEGVAEDVVVRSTALGQAIAAHIFAWSQSDGGAVVENMGFPLEYTLTEGPAHWVPTSLIRQQQMPLLPNWGNNRTFAMADGGVCGLEPPLEYSEDPGSAFYKEANEVYTTSKSLTDEQKLIARFWSDDPMLSPTPPGHWISIAMQILARDHADAPRCAEVLALLGIAVADAFIACWHEKFRHDLLRPVTYIRRVIDKTWNPLLITPPFPEYPSGHSTQSGAAAEILTHLFGADFAFDDATHEKEGLGVRSFPDFNTAAEEAAISRLYGGIHFRAANERGLAQGRCIGAQVSALKTRG